MTGSGRLQLAATGALAVACAEGASRLLAPRERLLDAAPVRLKDHFPAEDIARGRRYSRPQIAIGIARSAVDAAGLIWVVRRVRVRDRGQARLRVDERDWESRFATRPLAGGAAVAAALSVGLSIPGLPLAALARQRSVKVGLATQSWRGWGIDLLKASGIQSVIAAGTGAATIAAISRWPRAWWLPAAAGSVALGAGLAALAPVVLDPLFNDFTPLPEGQTRSDVLELARAAEVKVGEVFSVDASRRTTAANAYVTGLGPTKRVVLFDTLLSSFTRDEVRVVVAHELAHVHHRDVLRSVGYAALTAPAAALAAQRLSWMLSPVRDTAAILPALALATGIVSVPIGLLAGRLSRAVERRADDFSLRLSDAPEAFVSFERTVVRQNVADPAPPRWLRLLASHPPTDERIGMALSYAEARPGSAGRAAAPTSSRRA